MRACVRECVRACVGACVRASVCNTVYEFLPIYVGGFVLLVVSSC